MPGLRAYREFSSFWGWCSSRSAETARSRPRRSTRSCDCFAALTLIGTIRGLILTIARRIFLAQPPGGDYRAATMYRRILALSAVALMVPSCGKKPLALVGQFEGSAHVKFYDQAAMPTDKNVPGMRVRVSSKEIMTRDKVTHREDTRTAFSLDVEGGPFPKTCSLELY